MKLELEQFIKNQIIVDNAFGFEPEIEVLDKWKVLDRFQEVGFTCLSLSVATDMTNLSNTIHYLANTTAHIREHSDKYLLVHTLQDILDAKKEGKLALSYMFQGANPLEKNLNLVDLFYQLGVRSILVSYNVRNPYGDGCTEESDSGLSRLGRMLIQKLNSVGMLIDCAHTGYRTSLEVMEHSSKPVIFSHSNVYRLHPHARNLKDEQIIACAKGGGFIGINGNGPLLGDDEASVKKYVDHLDYIIQLVGDDHVGFGTDLVYFPEIFDDFMKKNAVVYPSNYGVKSISQWKSLQPEKLSEVILELFHRGYSKTSIRKILSMNYLRVVKSVWK
ncbi:MAG: dipeptidase [Chthoniobacterales bacterium]